MRSVSIREANQNLSKLVAEAEAGEEILLTRQGRPAARLVPPRAERFQRPVRGTPEWQAAYDHMMALMETGFDLGGKKVTYEDRTE